MRNNVVTNTIFSSFIKENSYSYYKCYKDKII